MSSRLKLGVLLPHLEVFGGVRRYLMLGRTWTSWGHEVVLFTPEGRPADWLETGASVRRLDAPAGETKFDAVFTPQPALLPALRNAPAERRVFYCVLEGEKGDGDALRDPSLTLMANSSALRASLARRS